MKSLPPLGSSEVVNANALALPIPSESVDLIVTSPPYFALRSYQDGGEHYEGQIGAEPTPQAFLEALWAVMAECQRVLKPTGSVWVNLGDKYVSSPPGNERSLANSADHQEKQKAAYDKAWRVPTGYRQKSLMGLPWRFAIGCIDGMAGDPWILRAEVIWDKPNGLPESVRDRVARKHEQWFHFTKSPRYFAGVDEIREPHAISSLERNKYAHGTHTPTEYSDVSRGVLRDARPAGHEVNPLGKLPGSVWRIATEPLKVPDHLGIDHFAAFPTEWPRRIILGWSPSGVCVECGEGRRPVAERIANGRERSTTTAADPSWQAVNRADWQENVTRTITGYACGCAEPTAPTTPAVVLDPFGGTGTTAMVAKALGRYGISVDLSKDYCRLAEWRTTNEKQLEKVRAKTLGVKVPAPRRSKEGKQEGML